MFVFTYVCVCCLCLLLFFPSWSRPLYPLLLNLLGEKNDSFLHFLVLFNVWDLQDDSHNISLSSAVAYWLFSAMQKAIPACHSSVPRSNVRLFPSFLPTTLCQTLLLLYVSPLRNAVWLEMRLPLGFLPCKRKPMICCTIHFSFWWSCMRIMMLRPLTEVK